MQYHYIVCFDDEQKKWWLDDEYSYLPDGNVWNNEDQEWFWPDENNSYPEYVIDGRCRQMIDVLASIWPAVDTEV